MSLNVKDYLLKNLIDPLKYYNTSTQEVILEIASQRIQQLYDLAHSYPEIVDIDKVTEYMLEDIAKSFDHKLDTDQSVLERRAVLSHIIETYKRRGSIDSLENMHRYYGGDLPKDVKVVVPAYDLFRYSISQYSGTHRFKDGKYWRSGVFDLLIRDEFDLEKLRTFVTAELVAAGAQILFSKESTVGGVGGGPVLLDTMKPLPLDVLLAIEMQMVSLRSGLRFSSGNGELSGLLPSSGRQTLFTRAELTMELFTSMARKREDSVFKLNPLEVMEYFEYPEEIPINLLSGYPTIGTPVLVENPESVGLDSLIGKHRSYDYLYPARQYIWDIYPQRTSEHGGMSGKNSLSGTPRTEESDRSWNDLRRFPMKLDKLYERGIDKQQDIIPVNLQPLSDVVGEESIIEFNMEANFYNSEGTPDDIKADMRIDLTDVNDQPISPVPTGNYPGYFVLATTPLGAYRLEEQSYNGENSLTVA